MCASLGHFVFNVSADMRLQMYITSDIAFAFYRYSPREKGKMEMEAELKIRTHTKAQPQVSFQDTTIVETWNEAPLVPILAFCMHVMFSKREGKFSEWRGWSQRREAR